MSRIFDTLALPRLYRDLNKWSCKFEVLARVTRPRPQTLLRLFEALNRPIYPQDPWPLPQIIGTGAMRISHFMTEMTRFQFRILYLICVNSSLLTWAAASLSYSERDFSRN